MFTEARLLFERVRDELTEPADKDVLEGAIAAAQDTAAAGRGAAGGAPVPELTTLLAAHPIRELVTIEGPYPMYADRQRALFGAWYEFFPRSEGATVDPETGHAISGNFRTAMKRLDYAADLGFDVVYLPPIHPIGEVNRKGPNNTLTPEPHDTGSPWAIGSKDGGHDAIHPDLGTFEDFDAFVAHARELGLEIALDLALQCAPDHPWVESHPEWFTTRADGTIAYAENPPKKYQDIYPVNFDNDPTGICREVLRIVKLWMSHGVRIFRVDNPHTKPVAFWEWLLREVRRTDPDVLFLAEAFTRPAMMSTLGAIGYHQSYTYFTWRTAKWEIEDYLRELSHHHRPRDAAELLRQHPRHPPRVAAVRRPGDVQDPRRAGGVRVAQLGRLLRLRAVRARRRAAGQRGVPRLREVPDPRPRLGPRGGRGPHARAVPARSQPRPARASRAAAAAQRDHPQRRRRERPGLQQAGGRRPRGHRHRRGQPGPARRPGDDRAPQHAGPRDGLARQLRRLRRDHRRRPGTGRSTTSCAWTPATSLPTS